MPLNHHQQQAIESNFKGLLEKLFDQLKKDNPGLNLTDDNKEDIINQVMENLKDAFGSLQSAKDNLTEDKVKTFLKALKLALVLESEKIDSKGLFKKIDNDDELKKELKNELKLLFERLRKLAPNPEKVKTDELTEKHAENLKLKMKSSQKKSESDEYLDTIGMMLTRLFGTDTRNPGATVKENAFQENTEGNRAGIASVVVGELLTFMGKINDAEPGGFDYNTTERFALNNMLAQGQDLEVMEKVGELNRSMSPQLTMGH